MNLAIYKKGTDIIKYFILDCIKTGDIYTGSNMKISSLPSKIGIMWTNDIVNIVYDENGNKIGFDKSVSELTEANSNSDITKPSHNEYVNAINIRKLLNSLTYEEVEEYIDNNVVDLSSAKEYLKKLSKVVLAISRIVDKEMK